MSGGKGGSQPLPDYGQMIEDQAYYNRINQYGPGESMVYNRDRTSAERVLSPAEQQRQNLSMGLSNTAMGEMLGWYGGQPSETSRFNPITGQYEGAGGAGGGGFPGGTNPAVGGGYEGLDYGNQDLLNMLMQGGGGLEDLLAGGGFGGGGGGSYNYQGAGGGNAGTPGTQMLTYDEEGNPTIGQGLMSDLDLSSLPGFADEGDLMGARDRAESAMFQRAMGLLEPGFQQRSSAEAEMLANRGLGEGSEIAGIYGGNRDQAYNQARQMAALDAVREGRTEYGFLSGEARATRGQTLSERLQQAGLQNATQRQMMEANLGARGQEWNEMYGRGQLGMQGASINAQSQASNNALRFQMYQQGINNQLQAQSQLWNQQMGERGTQYQELSNLFGLGSPAGMQGYWQPGQVDVIGSSNQAASNQAQNFQNSPLGIALGLGGQLMGAAGQSAGGFAGLFGSSINYKDNFEELDSDEVLDKVNRLDIPMWNYKGDDNNKHIGPIAEQFTKEFGTQSVFDGQKFEGKDLIGIDAISVMGVALKSIQALTKKVDELESRLGESNA